MFNILVLTSDRVWGFCSEAGRFATATDAYGWIANHVHQCERDDYRVELVEPVRYSWN